MSSDGDLRGGIWPAPPKAASRDLVDALGLALLGVGTDGWSADGLTHSVLANRRVAGAFLPGATACIVDCGLGLWAVLRRSADGSSQVLCTHNVTDRTQTFRPASRFKPWLSDEPRLPEQSPLLFLCGQTITTADSAGLICRLGPHTFVWLGHFAEGGPADSAANTPMEF